MITSDGSEYVLKADHKAEIQGLELEIELLKADEVGMKKKLKENVKLARVEVAREIIKRLDKENRSSSDRAFFAHNKCVEIIEANTEGE